MSQNWPILMFFTLYIKFALHFLNYELALIYLFILLYGRLQFLMFFRTSSRFPFTAYNTSTVWSSYGSFCFIPCAYHSFNNSKGNSEAEKIHEWMVPLAMDTWPKLYYCKNSSKYCFRTLTVFQTARIGGQPCTIFQENFVVCCV